MTIINTTFIIEQSKVRDVLDWIKTTYIPSATHGHALKENTLLTRVLNQQDEDSQCYAVHLWFDSMEQATEWDIRLGSRLRTKLSERWGEKVLAFHTYMEVTE